MAECEGTCERASLRLTQQSVNAMNHPDKGSRDDARRSQQHRENSDDSDDKQKSSDQAPGEGNESAYPDDDYWDEGVRDKSKKPPEETPEPDTGYRWEDSDEKSS